MSKRSRSARLSSTNHKSSRRHRYLTIESLEPREVLSGSSLTSAFLSVAMPMPSEPGHFTLGSNSSHTTAPAPTPSFVKIPTITGTSGTTVLGTTASVTEQATETNGQSTLTYSWQLVSGPQGGTVTFATNNNSTAMNDTFTFTKCGAYQIKATVTDAAGKSVQSTFTVTVVPVASSVTVSTGDTHATLTPSTPYNVVGTTQNVAVQAYDQFGNLIPSSVSCSWNAAATASNTRSKLVTNNTSASYTFTAAGAYTASVTATCGGKSVSAGFAFNVTAKATSVSASQKNGAANVTTTSTQIAIGQVLDQFNNPISATTIYSWSTTTLPSGATTPTFSTSATTTTATFGAAGSYVLKLSATVGSTTVTTSVSVKVVQTLTKINLTPKVSALQGGATQQFAAQGVDQFGAVMASSPTWAWSATAGTINGSGLFTAPNTSEQVTITVSNQSVSSTDAITVTASNNNNNGGGGGSGGSNFLGLGDASLATLVQTLDGGGSITRNDMLQIFATVAAKGTLSSTDFADLKTILADATQLNMPGYVQVLAHDVILGNTANATYLGSNLGNLAAGSTATHLNDLVDKWFLGADLPVTTFAYGQASGSLFPSTPSYLDERQGELGDCYFISTLGMIADNNPTAIENMFINNGDGTFTVRFFGGNYGGSYNSDGSVSDGFVGGKGTADYVTVNLMLPESGGALVYSGYGLSLSSTSNSLWLPLAEKAYAQWNQTGNEGRDNSNTYAGIEGGWMGTVNAQVLGYNATDYYSLTTGDEQAAINALNSNLPVTMGTTQNGGDGLYGSHAYGVLSYNASSGMFTLYNPWGFSQPGQLSWTQLEQDCDGFVVASPTSSTAVAANSTLNKLGPKAAVESAVESNLGSTTDTFAATPSNVLALATTTASNVATGGAPALNSNEVASISSTNDFATRQTQMDNATLDLRCVDAIFADLDTTILISQL